MVSFEELRQAYEQHLRSLQRTRHTIQIYRQWSAEFIELCRRQFELTDPRGLQGGHIVAYVKYLQDRGLSPSTIYARQRGLRTWLRWGLLRGYLLLDPGRDLHWKHPAQLPRGAPTEAQVRAVLEAPNPKTWRGRRDRALFEFLYGTGLRSGECIAVDLDHLCLKTLQLRVVHGKGRRQRVVPIGPRLGQILQAYLDEVRLPVAGPDTNALWVRPNGRRLTRNILEETMQNYTLDLELKNFSPYSFRHAFATHMLARGASLILIQRLLGHVTLQMTTRYTHLVPADLQAELLRTHPRGRRRSPKGPK